MMQKDGLAINPQLFLGGVTMDCAITLSSPMEDLFAVVFGWISGSRNGSTAYDPNPLSDEWDGNKDASDPDMADNTGCEKR